MTKLCVQLRVELIRVTQIARALVAGRLPSGLDASRRAEARMKVGERAVGPGPKAGGHNHDMPSRPRACPSPYPYPCSDLYPPTLKRLAKPLVRTCLPQLLHALRVSSRTAEHPPTLRSRHHNLFCESRAPRKATATHACTSPLPPLLITHSFHHSLTHSLAHCSFTPVTLPVTHIYLRPSLTPSNSNPFSRRLMFPSSRLFPV